MNLNRSKSAEGHMSFIFCDADTKQIIDIIEDCRLSSLQAYFKRYTKDARSRVKHIINVNKKVVLPDFW